MIFYRVSLIIVYAQLPEMSRGIVERQQSTAVKQESGVMCGRKMMNRVLLAMETSKQKF